MMKKLTGEMRIWTLELSSRLATRSFLLRLDDLEDDDGYLPPQGSGGSSIVP